MYGRYGSIGGLIVVVILIGVGFVNVYLRKGRVGEEYRKEVHALVAKRCDGYKDNMEYIDWLVDASHDEAFSKNYQVHYSPGSRYRASRDESTFDVDAYAEQLFAGMIAKARDDKAENIAKAIEKMKQELEEEAEKEEAAEAATAATLQPPGSPGKAHAAPGKR